MASAVNKKGNNGLLWKLLCCVLLLICIGLLIGIIILAVAGRRQTVTCSTPHCVEAAGKLLSKIDAKVDPCDNFYEFACGGWLKKNVIPDDRSSHNTFSTIREELQVILKELFEREKSMDDLEVFTKVKDFYASCVDMEKMEERDEKPLIELFNYLGGWPVLGSRDGGFWNERDFDLVALMGRLSGEFNNDIIISSWAGGDDKNSTRYVLHIDQPSLGMSSRDYYLEEQYANYKQAYYDYMIRVATMLGADERRAKTDMTAVLEYETKLANITVPKDQRRDREALYNPTTIGDLDADIPQIQWTRYFDIIMPNETKPIPSTEEVINYSPNYITNAARITVDETPKRVVANYLIWSITMNRMATMSQRFRDARQKYINVLYGTSSEYTRWRYCVNYVNNALMFATGRMYVEENFVGNSKANIEEIITNVKTAFKEMLENNDWMDEKTKMVARDKCDAVRDQIGYPDWIKNDTALNDYYEKLPIAEGQYFENVLKYIGWTARENLIRLRRPVDKNEWYTGPAVVNAFYSKSKNLMFFPAGILRSPYYHADSPWYLNYGAIGMVVGHELTHGFDDRGRQFDKDGNLKQWWSEESIANFKERTQCVIDQYDKYVMPENNKTINGALTQGENIADNGGLKEAFKAYKDGGYSKVRIPGFGDFTPDQLFFISYAQSWCSLYRRESADSKILTGPHSPGQYRVIGPFHNSFDFASVFNCPEGSNMNPPAEKKCVVW